jgi:hypothetical protein
MFENPIFKNTLELFIHIPHIIVSELKSRTGTPSFVLWLQSGSTADIRRQHFLRWMVPLSEAKQTI